MPLPFTALAAVYDAIMQDVEYDYWADFVLSYARDRGREGGRALDLACGTGSFTRELYRAGWHVTGLDGSAEMLAVARERLLPEVALHQGDIRTFTLPERFDLITCVFDSLNNMLTPQDLGQAFRQIEAHLQGGGLLACDLNTRLGVRELWEGGAIEDVVPVPGGEVHYHWSHHYDPETELGVVQAFCRQMIGERTEEFLEVHHERGYDPQEIATLLQDAGFRRFEIVEYPDYADPDADTPRVWVFAWKEAQA